MASFIYKHKFFSSIYLPLYRQIRKCRSLTGNQRVDKALNTVTRGRVETWLKQYEEFIGLAEVKGSQNHVLELEKKFLEKQKERRIQQQQLSEIHSRLHSLRTDLEQTSRGEDRYVNLVVEENKIIKEEKALSQQMEVTEQQERDAFAELSSSVRESHEKERQYTERTKYWSISFSLVGVILGIIGTTINNKLRMNELKNIIKTADKKSDEYKHIAEQLCSALETEHSKLEIFVKNVHALSEDSSQILSSDLKMMKQDDIRKDAQLKTFSDIQRQSKEILAAVNKQEKILDKELTEIKKILSTTSDKVSDGNVVYVGPEVKGMLNETEKNLELKIKMNSLWTVTFIYGAIALTLPIVFSIFKGS